MWPEFRILPNWGIMFCVHFCSCYSCWPRGLVPSLLMLRTSATATKWNQRGSLGIYNHSSQGKIGKSNLCPCLLIDRVWSGSLFHSSCQKNSDRYLVGEGCCHQPKDLKFLGSLPYMLPIKNISNHPDVTLMYWFIFYTPNPWFSNKFTMQNKTKWQSPLCSGIVKVISLISVSLIYSSFLLWKVFVSLRAGCLTLFAGPTNVILHCSCELY